MRIMSRVLAVVVIVLLVMAGCSGKKGDTGKKPTTQPAKTATETATT